MLCVIRDPKTFQATCDRTTFTDDLTVGVIISNVDVILVEEN